MFFIRVKPSPAYRFLLDRVAPKRGHFVPVLYIAGLVDATLDVDKRSSSCPVQVQLIDEPMRWMVELES